MAAYKMSEIRCDICDDGHVEWDVTVAWLRKFLKEEEGWKIGRHGDICPRCAQEAKS